MSTYVIGDIQGCFDQLLALLDLINFDPSNDILWFTGDLVNRGPKSLEVLRFVRSLPHTVTVLGNHDLTLLALAYSHAPIKHHTLNDILEAPDREALLTWLRHIPLVHEDKTFGCLLVHAGIPPQWSIAEAINYAREVEDQLRSDHYKKLLENMFGNFPNYWKDELSGWDRYRFIINSLTRLRFCDERGQIDLSYKGSIENAPPGLIPWFNFLPANQKEKIIFGHWAALEGRVHSSQIAALDTGCFWGGALTAMRLEDGKKFDISCKK